MYSMSKIKDNNIKRIKDIVGRYSPDNLPSCSSKDSQEKKDYDWIQSKIRAKQGKGDGTWYFELEEIANENGFKDLFKSYEEKFKERLEKFCQKYSKKKLPSLETSQHKDAVFLEHLKNLKKKGGIYWNNKTEGLLKKYDINITRKPKNKETAIKRLYEIMDYYHPKDLPKRNGKKDKEHQDAIWIFHMRAAKRGTGKYIWHPELEEIADKNGFKGLFERKRPTYKKT